MELKVQGSLLTEGILDAILERTDGGMTEFDIIGREEELRRQLAENIPKYMQRHYDILSQLKRS